MTLLAPCWHGGQSWCLFPAGLALLLLLPAFLKGIKFFNEVT
jgi:hypothetical protein